MRHELRNDGFVRVTNIRKNDVRKTANTWKANVLQDGADASRASKVITTWNWNQQDRNYNWLNLLTKDLNKCICLKLNHIHKHIWERSVKSSRKVMQCWFSKSFTSNFKIWDSFTVEWSQAMRMEAALHFETSTRHPIPQALNIH